MTKTSSLILFAAAAIAILCAAPNANYVTIVNPYNYTVYSNTSYSNGTVYLGNVGPGQSFYVTISSQTTNKTGFVFNYGWNRLTISNLPNGWIAQNSSLNNQYLSSKIAVSPYAGNGTYYFNLTAVNAGNYSKLGALKFSAYVNVTPNVFSLNVSPPVLSAGPGQPAEVLVTIDNTGVSDSPFLISLKGLPAWNTSATVIALHHTTGRFSYPIYENEPGAYHIVLYVNSTASPLVSRQSNVTLIVNASIANDYAALGQGSPLFPVVYAPAYAVMYLIGLLAKLVV